MKSIDFLGKVLELYTKRFIDYTNGKLEQDPDIEELTEVDMDPELVNKITSLIPKVKNDLSLLEEVYRYEYQLFPVLKNKTMRNKLFESLMELMKHHDLKIMIDYDENESGIRFTHYTRETLNLAIIFYQDLERKSEKLRSVLLAPLEVHLSKFESADRLPDDIVKYLEPYRLSESEYQILDLIEELKEVSYPKEHVFRNDKSSLDVFFSHFNSEHTIKEDVEFMTNYLASLYEEYEKGNDGNVLLENDLNFFLEELDVDDFYDAEDRKELSSASKDLERAEDKIKKLDDDKEVKKSDSEYKEEVSKKDKAKKVLIKSAKKIKNLLTRAISLKSENVEKTLGFQYTVLRIAIAAFVIAGAVVIPEGLITKLISVIVATTAVDNYTMSRAVRTVKVLENQLDALDDRIDDEDDPAKLRELKNLRSDVEAKIEETRIKIDNNKKAKKVAKNKITKGSSGSDTAYDY